MALTAAELQAQLIANQQAEAANTVALIEAIVDGRFNLKQVDFNDLEAKVTALNTLLDGDPDSEGFQAFASLVARMVAVETDNTAQATAIASLQTLVNSEVTRLDGRIDDIDTAYKAADAALDTRVTTLETNATAAEAARLSKDNEHDSKIAALETTATNLESALTAEATARTTADQVNTDAINVEKGRVDSLITTVSTFATRQEIADNKIASAQAFIDKLWAGRTRPADLPNADGSVSS